jgi:hypothetical protein
MGVWLQAGKTILAERTAASRSLGVDKGTADSFDPSIGDITGSI